MVVFSLKTIAAKPEWLFNKVDIIEDWTTDSNMLQYEIINGKCVFFPSGDLPFISYKSDEKVDLSKYRFLSFRASSNTEGYSLKFVFELESSTSYEYSTELKSDGEWHDYTINFSSDIKASKFFVYFLSDNYAESQARISFDGIGLFENKTKAESFLKTTPTTIKEKEELFTPLNNGPFMWDFSTASDIYAWNINAETFHEVGMLKLSPKNSQVINISYDFKENHFNAREYPYFAIRYKALSQHDVSYISFYTNESSDVKSHFTINNDGAWHNKIIDMSKYSHRLWNGFVESLSLCFPDESDDKDVVYIERLGFFSNYNDASEYLLKTQANDNYSETKIYSGDNYKITVPAGAMTEQYRENDVVAVNIHAQHSNSSVVMLNESPVVLSDVSEHGYVVYFADQKGEYSVIDNTKEFNDISNHWAKQYIDYVTSRGIFVGTAPNIFSPETIITKGMFITVLGRIHGVKVSSENVEKIYSDVFPDEYYSPYVKWASENRIYSPDGTLFKPNSPITRGEMALIISNYIEWCKYSFVKFNNQKPFSDIQNCDLKIKEAINNIQSLEIINGKTETLFVPEGYLTRAEASTVITRLIKSILGVFYPGKNNIRHDDGKIHIGVYSNFDVDMFSEKLLDMYKTAGFDLMFLGTEVTDSDKRETVLKYCDTSDISVFLPITSDKSPLKSSLQYYGHPSFAGNYILEEPGTKDFDVLGEFSQHYTSEMISKDLIINLLTLYSSDAQLNYGALASSPDYYTYDIESYRRYLEQSVSSLQTNVLLTNLFPFRSEGYYDGYVDAVAVVADTALNYNKDFWCIIQCDDKTVQPSHFLQQYYTLLSFGCRNFLLWAWNDGLCYGNANPTESYHSVKEANKNISYISDVLYGFKYLNTTVYNSEKKDNSLLGIQPDSEFVSECVSDSPVIIGEYINESDEIALVITNYSEKNNNEVKLRLSGHSSSTIYYGADKKTILPDSDGYYHLNLSPGNGGLLLPHK